MGTKDAWGQEGNDTWARRVTNLKPPSVASLALSPLNKHCNWLRGGRLSFSNQLRFLCPGWEPSTLLMDLGMCDKGCLLHPQPHVFSQHMKWLVTSGSENGTAADPGSPRLEQTLTILGTWTHDLPQSSRLLQPSVCFLDGRGVRVLGIR